MPVPTLLTPDEAAARLGLMPQTLARWRSEGCSSLRFVKLGSRVMYDEADIAAYIDTRRRRSTSDTGEQPDADAALSRVG